MRPVRSFGVFGWKEIPWYRRILKPSVYRNRKDVLAFRPPSAEPVPDDGSETFPLVPFSAQGKISDAGYDRAGFLYFALPADRDFTFRAVLRILSFPERDRATRQEGCGLFLRDTMKLDRKTGQPYSNMFLAGACLAGWNCFLRTGVDRSVSRIDNDGFRPEGTPAYPVYGTAAEIVLIREGGLVRAGIRVPGNGEDALSERTVPADTWSARDRRFLYAGFLVTGGCEAEVLKDTVVLEVRPGSGKKAPPAPARAEKAAAGNPPAGREGEPKTVWAAPDGRPEASGSPDDPADLETAVRIGGTGGTVRLAPGVYRPAGTVVLDSADLVCEAPEGTWAVLDFGGRQEGLEILGNGSEIRGIAVTRGLGFMIRGSGNRISHCAAAYNLETGFLIRRRDDGDPRETWPSGNVVEDCVSFCNRDPSGHNADGFASKVSAGEGNVFRRCTAFLNTDDGFDLFSKNRPTGAAVLEDCEAFMNGYRFENGALVPTEGNGSGFKMGGSGLRVEHRALRCAAAGNRGWGFTSNSNPWMDLRDCTAGNNLAGNCTFYFTGRTLRIRDGRTGCRETDDPGFDPAAWLREKTEKTAARGLFAPDGR